MVGTNSSYTVSYRINGLYDAIVDYARGVDVSSGRGFTGGTPSTGGGNASPDLVDYDARNGTTIAYISQSTIYVGDYVSVRSAVQNIGTAAAGSFSVSFYASTDSIVTAGDYFLGSATIGSVAANGGSAYADWNGYLSSIAPGNYYLGWIIDSGNSVAESSESNNIGVLLGSRFTVLNRNTAPVATADYYQAVAGQTLSVYSPGVLSNDTDADGDAMTASVYWSPSYGTLSLDSTGGFRYTPSANFVGTDYFYYVLSDGRGGSSYGYAVIDVSRANTAPVATTDSYQAIAGQTLTVNWPGVLSNDSDADGDALTASVYWAPSYGSLTLDSSGSFRYTPNANYVGTDSFYYLLSDGRGGYDYGYVVIDVSRANTAPVATADYYQAVAGQTLTVNWPGVLSNDSDADGDTLTASVYWAPNYGTLSLDSTGAFRYTPYANVVGTDYFYYLVSDGRGGSSYGYVVIDVALTNTAPVANDDSYQVKAGQTLTITGPGLLVNDFDADGDVLTTSYNWGTGHGAFSLGSRGDFTYTPDAGFTGTDWFIYNVSDGKGGWAYAKAIIEVKPEQNFANDGILTDTFERTVLGGDWTVVNGSFSVDGQRAVATAVGVSSVARLNGVSVADVSVSANVQLASSGASAGLVARFSGSGERDFYLCQLVDRGASGYRLEIWKNVAGAWTRLASAQASGPNGKLRFDVIGNRLTLFLNGESKATVLDSSLSFGGVGLRGWSSATFDDFSVLSPDSKAASPLPYTDDFNLGQSDALRAGWIEVLGNLSIDANRLKGQAGATSVGAIDGVLIRDVSVQATVASAVAGSSAALVARYSGPGESNFYMAQLADRGAGGYCVEIWKNVDGGWTMLSKASVGASTGILRFDAVSQSLTAYFNGQLVARAQDASITGAGAIGVRAFSSATFDDFKAQAPAATTVAPTFRDDFSDRFDLNWSTLQGRISSSNGIGRGASGVASLATASSVSMVNVDLQVDANVSATGSSVGLIARYSGPGESNFYMAQWANRGSSFRVEIWRNIGGVWAMLASKVVASGVGTLRFTVGDSTLTAFANGVQVAQATDSSLGGPGGVGMRLYSDATVDNYVAKSN